MSKVKPSLAEILNAKKDIKLPKETKDKRTKKNVIIEEENNEEEVYDKNSSTLDRERNEENEQRIDKIVEEQESEYRKKDESNNEEENEVEDKKRNEKEMRRIKLMKKLEKLEKDEPDTEDDEYQERIYKREREEEKRPRRRSRSPKRDDPAVRDENIFKAGLNEMLKNNSESFGSDCIDLLREVLKDIMKNIFVNLDDGKLSQAYIGEYMKKFFREKDFEKDIDVCISPVVFEKKIRELADEHKCLIRKDALYMLHTCIEKMLINCIKGGEMIANANKRSRLGPKDIGLTYAILML